MRNQFPLYDKGVAFYLDQKILPLTRLLRNKNLSQDEKTLLRTRLALRDHRFKNAQELLHKTWSNDFLSAEASLLQATLFSRLDQKTEAISANRSALRNYQKLDDRRGQFLCHYNLSVDYQNLRRPGLSQVHLDQALKLAHDGSEKALALRALACQASRDQNFPTALKHIEQLLSLREVRSVDQRSNELVAMDIYVRAGQFTKANDLAQSFSGHEKDPAHARRLFHKNILDRLLSGKHLSHCPTPVRNSTELYTQWQVIYNLERGDVTLAKQYWQSLVRLNPQLYGKVFLPKQMSDESALYFRVLKKISYPVSPFPFDEFPLSPLEKKLIRILAESPYPLRKEEIIPKLWKNSDPSSKEGYFYKVVERIRNKCGEHSIASQNRCYSFKSPEKTNGPAQ